MESTSSSSSVNSKPQLSNHVTHMHPHPHLHQHAYLSPIYVERSRERLRRDLVGLSDIEYREIFNMVRQKVNQYSENNNGIFINLKYIDDELLDKIYDFLEFSKKNKMYLKELEEKQNNERRTIDTSLHQHPTLSRDNMANQSSQVNTVDMMTSMTKKTTVDNFTFQNFIDKLTITNMKMFPENERIVYPTIKQHKWNVVGVKARLLKKCKDINKYNYDRFLNPYLQSDDDYIPMHTRHTNTNFSSTHLCPANRKYNADNDPNDDSDNELEAESDMDDALVNDDSDEEDNGDNDGNSDNDNGNNNDNEDNDDNDDENNDDSDDDNERNE
jgi:hypothetical protein